MLSLLLLLLSQGRQMLPARTAVIPSWYPVVTLWLLFRAAGKWCLRILPVPFTDFLNRWLYAGERIRLWGGVVASTTQLLWL